MWREAENVLVVRPDNIGDVVMAGPALRAIKENLPRARLTLMASPGGAQVAPLLPWVDEVLPRRVLWQDMSNDLPFDPGRELALVETLRGHGFDAAVILTSFSQTPHPAGLLCYLAGIPLRLGESKEKGGGALSTEVAPMPDGLHQVERSLRLLEAVGFGVSDRSLEVRVPEDARREAVRLLAAGGVPGGDPYLLLNPWTSCAARTYATVRFARAARALAEETGWPVVVTGVEKDRGRAGPLLQTLGDRAVDLVGATGLAPLAALVEGARLVLTNNTSVMHLADATRTPSVVTFSGTELESQWRPRSAPARLLRRPTVCSPCYRFTCPYNLECLDIPPDEVVEAGLGLLAAGAEART